MSLVEIVDDLLTLEKLAAHEDDPDRRRSLDGVRDHVADRDRGAKVSEVAQVLGISQPTVRAWIDAGVLEPRGDTTPVRVDVLSLAAVKRALDLLREHGHDRNLLIAVMRILRDRAVLAGEGAREGIEDLAAGRVVPLTDDLLDEIATASPVDRRRLTLPSRPPRPRRDRGGEEKRRAAITKAVRPPTPMLRRTSSTPSSATVGHAVDGPDFYRNFYRTG